MADTTTDAIQLAGLGTDGTEGIPAGIHLRWAFPEKLGFPRNGIRLYRADDGGNAAPLCWTAAAYEAGTKVPVTGDSPGFTPVSGGNDLRLSMVSPMHWKAAGTATTEVTELSVLNKAQRVYQAKLRKYAYTTHRTVSLPAWAHLAFDACAPSRIELTYFATSATNFTVTPLKGDQQFDAIPVSRSPLNEQTIVIQGAGITGLLFEGTGMFIISICMYCCREHDVWTELTLGFDYGLPYQLNGDALASISNHSDHDYRHALFRLGADKDLLSYSQFSDLKPLIAQMMVDDGTKVPVGWSMPPEADSAASDEAQLEVGSYDTLQLGSLQPQLARVLGLAWTDVFTSTSRLYDYKVVATYPKDHLARLQHQRTFSDLAITDDINADFWWPDDPNVILHDLRSPRIFARPSSLARANVGLYYLNQSGSRTRILFNKPVKEVQLFVKFSGTRLTVYWRSATDTANQWPGRQTITAKETVIKISGDAISAIRLSASSLVLYHLHYDFEKCSGLTIEGHVCSLTRKRGLKLVPPTGVMATALPAAQVSDENQATVAQYGVGVRWNYDFAREPLPAGPVAWHILRKSASTAVETLTPKGPIMLSGTPESGATPPGWPAQRQWFVDKLNDTGTWSYAVKSVDLFGRISAQSSWSATTVKQPVPPPPNNVRARFLDYSAIDSSGAATDPALTATDVAWLNSNRRNAIAIEWEWTAEQAAQFPTSRFKIHFENGWLNLLRGTLIGSVSNYNLSVTTLRPTTQEQLDLPILAGRTSYATYQLRVQLDRLAPADGLRLCRFKQGHNSFIILRNSRSTMPYLWLLVPPTGAEAIPDPDQPFTIQLNADSSMITDYSQASNWTNTTIAATETSAGARTYRKVLSSPAFPTPAFLVNDPNPMRYGQIAVSSVNEEGVTGPVSAAQTIMAVNRKQPSAIAATNLDSGTGMATKRDIHGKSTYYLRWKKSGLQYFVYRAMDETVFSLDMAATGRERSYYNSLSDTQLRTLSNQVELQAAFSKLNATPISESDATYANRNTETPVPGSPPPVPDSTFLLFEDATLDGRGTNRYFYKVQTVDPAGSLGKLSTSLGPVYIPQVTAPAAPAIASIAGEKRQISITWSHKATANTTGYDIYRTTDASKANDTRLMERLGADTDSPLVAVGDSLAYTDSSVTPRITYYYGIVARAKDSDGLPLQSQLSATATAEAWDDTVPEIDNPVLTAELDYEALAITLDWETDHEEYRCMLTRTPAWSDGLPREMAYVDEETGTFGFTFVDTEVDQVTIYRYSLAITTDSGQEADVKLTAEVIP